MSSLQAEGRMELATRRVQRQLRLAGGVCVCVCPESSAIYFSNPIKLQKERLCPPSLEHLHQL